MPFNLVGNPRAPSGDLYTQAREYLRKAPHPYDVTPVAVVEKHEKSDKGFQFALKKGELEYERTGRPKQAYALKKLHSEVYTIST